MPASAEEGRDVMRGWVDAQHPHSLLDIGAGCGTYAQWWRYRAPRPYLIGVEIWRPYLREFRLDELYDHVIVRDIREMPLPEWPRTDVVILGDVLEHMTAPDAIRVWNLACASARKAVYLSIPIVHSPQGAVHDNPYEEHVDDHWTHERVMDSFPLISWYWKGTIVGRYEAKIPRGDQR